MNKGVVIGIGIAIIIGGIVAAYSFLGIQDSPNAEQQVGLAFEDTAEVTVKTPTEEEPLSVNITVIEGIGIKAETP